MMSHGSFFRVLEPWVELRGNIVGLPRRDSLSLPPRCLGVPLSFI